MLVAKDPRAQRSPEKHLSTQHPHGKLLPSPTEQPLVVFCTQRQHMNIKFQVRLHIAQGDQPFCTVQTLRCGFAQRVPRSRKANSPAFCKQKHHEGHAANSRRSAPSFSPQERNILFSKIPSTPQIVISIKIPLPLHLLYCPECKHMGKESFLLRILHLLSLSTAPPTSFTKHTGKPGS